MSILFDEDFENHLWTGSNGNPWFTGSCPGGPVQDGCNPVISTDLAHSGTHSLKGIYTGSDSGVWIDRNYTLTTDIYVRWWYRTASFTYEGTGAGTKHFNIGQSGIFPNFWLINNATDGSLPHFLPLGQALSAQEISVGSQTEADGFNWTYGPNLAHVPLNDNQWYHIEVHIRMNTAGVADGVVELWITPSGGSTTKTTNYTGRMFRGAGSTAAFDFMRLFVQHGIGSMYYDQLGVGTTRFDDSGSGTPDTTPPAIPTGVTVS